MIIIGAPDDSEIAHIAKHSTDDIVCINSKSSDLLRQQNISHRLLEDYPIDLDIVENEAFKILNNLATLKLDHSNLIEALSYHDSSLWYFLEVVMYVEIKNLIVRIMLLESCFRSEHPDSIKLAGVEGLDLEVIKQISQQHSVAIIDDKCPRTYQRPGRNAPNSLLLLARYLLRGLAFNGPRSGHRDITNVLMLSYDADWRTAYDHRLGRYTSYNVIMSPVSRALEQNEDIEVKMLDVSSHPFKDLAGTVKSLSKRSKFENIVTWESFLNAKLFRKAGKEHGRIKGALVEKMQNADLSAATKLSFSGADIGMFVRRAILDYIQRDLYFVIASVETCEELLKKNTTHVVVLINEYSGMGLALSMAAKSVGIPVVAMQHGHIAKYQIGYHNKVNRNLVPNYPLPDRMLLYGQYTKKLLEEFGFPEKILSVVGDPKLDVLVELLPQVDRNRILQSIGLDPSKKTILYATQPFTLGQKEYVVDVIMGAMSELKDTQLVIKPHPTETDLLPYAKMIEQLGNERIKQATDISTYELLASCDLVLTVTSTTMIEAMVGKKPVVLVDLPGESHFASFLTEGGGIVKASGAEQLAGRIQFLIGDNYERRSSIERQNELLEELASDVDGRASYRVAREIMDAVKK